MNNVFPIPKELRHRVISVSDNRKPGDEIVLDPQLFVSIFRVDLEQWLEKHREDIARQKYCAAG